MSALYSHLLAWAIVKDSQRHGRSSKILNGMSIYDAQETYGIPIFVIRKWLEKYAEANGGGKQ